MFVCISKTLKPFEYIICMCIVKTKILKTPL